MSDGDPPTDRDRDGRRRFEDLTCVEFAAWLDEDDRAALAPREADGSARETDPPSDGGG